MATTITFGLSESEVLSAIKQLRNYKEELNRKCEILVERLAHEGVIIAQLKIMEYPAVYTGELLNSIDAEPGDIITNGSSWIVYTDCEWAKYVEFGTGIVGSQNPHPEAGLKNWKYDVNEHSESGWFYFKDGKMNWTNGMPSRPYFYEMRMELVPLVSKIAREVFRAV